MWGHWSARVVGIAVATALAGLSLAGTSVSAAAVGTPPGPVPIMTVHDPVGDVPYPQGDITGAGFAQDATNFAFGVTVARPLDPETDPAWHNGNAVLGFTLDANNDGMEEWYILALPQGPNRDAIVGLRPTANPGAPTCWGTLASIPGSGYRVTFPNRCLPGGVRFRFHAQMDFNPDPSNHTTATDHAPALHGWSAPITTAAAPPGASGYWMLGADGLVCGFGNVIAYTDPGHPYGGGVSNATAMSSRHDGQGYWIVDAQGHVFAWGTARYFGGSPALHSGEIVSSISATPDGGGYWLFTSQGRVFPFGNANSYGDMSGTTLNGPVVASVATPTGHGYYLVGSDGGIFSFGDARFHGSMGNARLTKPIVGIAPTRDNLGY